MFKVGQFSIFLILGLILSQLVPVAVGPSFVLLALPLRVVTMTALAFIMVRVGLDFDIDKHQLRSYAYDYCVAMIAAALPWALCALYFVFVMAPRWLWSDINFWEHTMLLSRFAAPTSAGVLFSMLAAAGLTGTWVFAKARILAIFDDVDTILAVTVLQIVMVG